MDHFTEPFVLKPGRGIVVAAAFMEEPFSKAEALANSGAVDSHSCIPRF
jgi:hypothetical protein